MRLLLLLLALGAAAGCRTHSDQIADFRGRYSEGDFEGADAAIDRLIAKEADLDAGEVASSGGLDASPGKGDTCLLLLEKAMTQLALGRPDISVELLRRARDQLDANEPRSAAQFFASVLTDDEARDYAGADYEHILVRTMLCLCDLLLHSSQTAGDAYAYALQVGEKQEQIVGSPLGEDVGYRPRQEYRRVGIGAYLQGVILEGTGARDGAAKAYRRCADYEPGFRLAQEAIRRATEGRYAEPGEGVLHVFHLGGPGPFYAQGVSPPTDLAFRIAQIAAALVADSYVPLAQADVPVPVLAVQAPSLPPLEVSATGRTATTEPLLDVNLVAGQQLEAMMPLIIARAVVRRAVKAAATTVASESVKRSNKGSTGDWAELGFAVATLLWTSAERADTRSWTSLPARISVARLPLGEGVHVVRLGPSMEAEVRIRRGVDSFAVVLQPNPAAPGAVLVDRLSLPSAEEGALEPIPEPASADASSP